MKRMMRYLFFLIITLLPFAEVRITVLGIPLYLPEIPIGIAALVYGVGVYRREIRFRAVSRVETAGMSLFLLGAVCASVSAGMNLQELGAIKSWFLFPMIGGFLVSQMCIGVEERQMMLRAWFITVVVTAGISLLPFPFVLRTYDGRLASFFTSPNHLAFFLEPGVLLGTFFCLGYIRKRCWSQSVLFFTETALVLLVLFETKSEGGMTAAVVGIVFFLVQDVLPRKYHIHCLFFAVFLGALLLPSSGIFENSVSRLESGEVRNSLASRVMIWNASVRMIWEHPFFGVGLRNFEREYLALQSEFPPYLEWAVPHPHDIFLATWLQTGIIGLTGFIFILGSALRSLWVYVRHETSAQTFNETALLLSFLVAFFVHGLVDTPFFRNDLDIQWFAVIGLVVAVSRKKTAERHPEESSTDRPERKENKPVETGLFKL